VRRKRDFYLQNTATTENLVRALVESEHQVKRFVLVSSLAAMGPSQEGQPHRGDEPPRPRSDYGTSKLAAEEAVMALAKELQVTIFRPPAIYGPGDNRFLPLFKAVKRGRVPLPPTKELSLIYVDDCARAIVAALGKDHPSGRHYYVDDGRPISLPQLAEATAIAMGEGGKRLRPQRVRSWQFYLAGGLNEMRAKMTRKPVILTRDKWRDGRHPYWTCDAGRTEADLGWTPQVSLEEGLAMTVAGYRERGWL
jgi:nucleoside-diphosphate-sugar epimerase